MQGLLTSQLEQTYLGQEMTDDAEHVSLVDKMASLSYMHNIVQSRLDQALYRKERKKQRLRATILKRGRDER
mgnify:CR=1 FL=1